MISTQQTKYHFWQRKFDFLTRNVKSEMTIFNVTRSFNKMPVCSSMAIGMIEQSGYIKIVPFEWGNAFCTS